MHIVEVAVSGTIGTRNMGPVSTDILELANRFAARGHRVTVADVASEAPRDLLQRDIGLVELPGIPESRIEAQQWNRGRTLVHSWCNSFRYVRALAQRIDLVSADIVHFNSPSPAFLARRVYGIDTVYTAHTPLWSLGQKPHVSLMRRFDNWVEREVIRRSRLTIGLGSYLSGAVPDADVATIPNGLDVESWSPFDRSSARAALGIGPLDFVLLFAGRIAPVKGVDVLLNAIKLVAPALPNLKVLLIGPMSGSFDTRDDYTTAYAREMLALQRGLPVSFLGFISNRDVQFRQYLTAADVFVLPSRREPQGLVVLESMAMGTPVIGSATGGIPDMVSSDVGYLFPPGDEQALAVRIKRAYDHPQELARMRTAARRRVEARYSWDDIADRYLAEFKRVLGSHDRTAASVDTAVPDELAP